MADWSLAQGVPNFAKAALSGYQAGAAIGKQRQLSAAMQSVDLDRPETLLPLLRADPSTGAALIGASVKLSAAKRDAEARQAKADYLTTMFPAASGGATGTTTAPSSGEASVAPSPAATADPNNSSGGDIVVSAPVQPVAPHPDPAAARLALIRSDPDAFVDLETKIGSMNKVQRANLDAANNTFGSAVEAAKAMPYEQRAAYIQSQKAQLVAHGVPEAQIDAFDPTDQNIVAVENSVLGVKGILEKQDKDRTFGLDQARFGESQRHNQVDEGQGAARIGLEGANVNIARGHLALAQHADARAAANAPNALGGPVARVLPNGVHAYRNPANGKWYDNPGFK